MKKRRRKKNMNEEEEEKHEISKVRLALILTVVAVILGTILLYPYYRPRKTVWCYFENNITAPTPLYECVHMKIISRDVERVNYEKFYELNVTDTGCVDSYEELPPCSGEEYHFTQFELGFFSISEDVDGTLCASYYVTFYESNDSLTEFHRDLYRNTNFKKQVRDVSVLREKLIGCEV